MASLLLDESELLKLSTNIASKSEEEDSDSDDEEILLLTPLALLGSSSNNDSNCNNTTNQTTAGNTAKKVKILKRPSPPADKQKDNLNFNLADERNKNVKLYACNHEDCMFKTKRRSTLKKHYASLHTSNNIDDYANSITNKSSTQQAYHQKIIREKEISQAARGTVMDDLSKIKKHPPHPPKNILEKSIRHMLDVKNYGKIVGDRPNLIFGWIQDEILNKHPLYQPLPHISRVNRTIGTRWLSQFEQHSYQSGEIHIGRITTRYLSSALGMHEPSRAAKCKIPQHRVGAKYAVKAYNEIKRVKSLIQKIDTRDAKYSYTNYGSRQTKDNDDTNSTYDDADSDEYITTSSRRTSNVYYKPNKMLRTNLPNYGYLSAMSNIGQELFALPLNRSLMKTEGNKLTKKGSIVLLNDTDKTAKHQMGALLTTKMEDGSVKETDLISPGTLVLPVAELTERRIDKRKRQVELGKMSEGYQHYIKSVPVNERVPGEMKHPKTPDVFLKVSKRSFEKQMRNWRNLLHLWDDPNINPMEDMKEMRLDGGSTSPVLGDSGSPLSGNNDSALATHSSVGLDLNNVELKKMISASFISNDTWCLDTNNDNVLISKGQSLLGIHVYHEDKRPGTKLVLYANDCASHGKQWELIHCCNNKTLNNNGTMLAPNNKISPSFLEALKGEYVFIRSKLNGYVVTIMEHDSKHLKESNQRSSITISTLNHSFRLALMPLGKTEREQKMQLWRKKVVGVRDDGLEWCKFYWHKDGSHPVMDNDREEVLDEDSDDDDDLNINLSSTDGIYKLSILSAEDIELLDLQKQNTSQQKLKHLHANQWWKRDMLNDGIYQYVDSSPQLRVTRPIPYKFKHSGEIAMAWGGIQEAVALVCLMDLFPNAKLKETGCLLLETILENVQDTYGVSLDELPLIGASPDGTLALKTGEVQIVEVKCTCPYTDNKGNNNNGGWRKSKKGPSGRYMVVDKPSIESIPPYHIPQLQMEILCSGPYCTGGWYVSYNATRGVSIFKIERDNEYIKQMLLLLKLFKQNNGRDSFQTNKAAFDNFTSESIKQSKRIQKWKHILPENVQHMRKTMRWFQ